jgi:hypothetical protein
MIVGGKGQLTAEIDEDTMLMCLKEWSFHEEIIKKV